MEEVIQRFPHLAEQISEILDDQSLTKCRNVGRSWKKLIDANDKMIDDKWTRICNIQGSSQGLTFVAKTGQDQVFQRILDKEADTGSSIRSNHRDKF